MLSGKFPGNSTLKIKILLESNPLKSIVLVRRLDVQQEAKRRHFSSAPCLRARRCAERRLEAAKRLNGRAFYLKQCERKPLKMRENPP